MPGCYLRLTHALRRYRMLVSLRVHFGSLRSVSLKQGRGVTLIKFAATASSHAQATSPAGEATSKSIRCSSKLTRACGVYFCRPHMVPTLAQLPAARLGLQPPARQPGSQAASQPGRQPGSFSFSRAQPTSRPAGRPASQPAPASPSQPISQPDSPNFEKTA